MKERIKLFIEYKGIGQRKFESSCGLANGAINNTRGNFTQKTIDKILNAYPEIRLDWLMNGTGEMLNSNTSIASEQEPIYGKNVKSGIPLIPFDGMAGWLSIDNPGVNLSECEQYNVPEFANKGADYIIRVSGSSMYPKYSNGDLLACKKIVDIIFFQWGKVYVLDTSQGVLVKRIFEDKNSDNNIILMSDNKDHYPAFTIPKSDIRSLSIVLGVIRME